MDTNLVNKPTWCTILFLFLSIFIFVNLYMFQAAMGPSSGDTPEIHKITSTKCRINTGVSPDDGPIAAQNT
jgi:hypothetical protein